MTTTDFYKRLIGLSAILLIALIGLSRFSLFEDTLTFSVVSLFIFILFTVFIFHLGAKSAESSNKNEFTGVAILAIFGKLVMVLAILFTYQSVVEPTSKMHVFPFLLIYLIFTIFETGVMMRLAKPPEE